MITKKILENCQSDTLSLDFELGGNQLRLIRLLLMEKKLIIVKHL